MKYVAIVLCILFLSGCATSDLYKQVSSIGADPWIPYDRLSIGGQPTIISGSDAVLSHTDGRVSGSRTDMIPVFTQMGVMMMPISTGSSEKYQFNLEDQSEFMVALKSELLRLNVFNSVLIADSIVTATYKIEISFIQTYHDVNRQEYSLNVLMNLEGGKESLLKQYSVNSNDRATTWEKWITNAKKAKAKAVLNLLDKIIPDIQAYIEKNT